MLKKNADSLRYQINFLTGLPASLSYQCCADLWATNQRQRLFCASQEEQSSDRPNQVGLQLGDGISSCCYIVNVHNHPSWATSRKEGMAWYSCRPMPSLRLKPPIVYIARTVQQAGLYGFLSMVLATKGIYILNVHCVHCIFNIVRPVMCGRVLSAHAADYLHQLALICVHMVGSPGSHAVVCYFLTNHIFLSVSFWG